MSNARPDTQPAPQEAHSEDAGARRLTDRRIISAPLHRIRARQSWSLTTQAPPSPPAPVRRPARIALMLALAHRLQRDIDRGVLTDRAELARTLGVSRPRITQLLALLLLAPDIQEELLHLEAVDGIEPMSERALRPLQRMIAWSEQREAWASWKKTHLPPQSERDQE
jgi:hypothetical protein